MKTYHIIALILYGAAWGAFFFLMEWHYHLEIQQNLVFDMDSLMAPANVLPVRYGALVPVVVILVTLGSCGLARKKYTIHAIVAFMAVLGMITMYVHMIHTLNHFTLSRVQLGLWGEIWTVLLLAAGINAVVLLYRSRQDVVYDPNAALDDWQEL